MFEVTHVVKKRINKDELFAVDYVSNFVYSKKNKVAGAKYETKNDIEDLKSELYLWLMEEYVLVERYRTDSFGKNKLIKAMINYSYKHLNQQKEETQPWLYDYPKATTTKYIQQILTNTNSSHTHNKIMKDSMSEALIIHFTTGLNASALAAKLGLQNRTLYRHIKNIHLAAAEEIEQNNYVHERLKHSEYEEY